MTNENFEIVQKFQAKIYGLVVDNELAYDATLIFKNVILADNEQTKTTLLDKLGSKAGEFFQDFYHCAEYMLTGESYWDTEMWQDFEKGLSNSLYEWADKDLSELQILADTAYSECFTLINQKLKNGEYA